MVRLKVKAWRRVLKILLVVLALNSVSYAIVALLGIFNRGVDIVTVRDGCENGGAVYLIGGCKSRTVGQFEFMLEAVPEEMAIYLVEYRNSGFNIKEATAMITEHMEAGGYEKVTFVAFSMGYQLAARSARESDKIIALNPCAGEATLMPFYRNATVALPIGYAGSFLMGWASYLPIIKVCPEPYYSPLLLLDQCAACSNNDTVEKYPFRPDVLILGRFDQVVNNMALLGSLANSPKIYWIDTDHFGMGGSDYLEVIAENLS